ncbi:MAG: hypothetical protein OEV64_12255, partial [Desulfobulbaceae bacterium]|nr:hypothetical protein [Desulfobulbaceae bacterium]
MKSSFVLFLIWTSSVFAWFSSVFAVSPSEPDLFSPRDEKRSPPPHLSVNEPRQLTFESDSVEHAAISRDGRFLVHTVRRQGFHELWLREIGSSEPALPVLLGKDIAEYRLPAISDDGRWVAFVSTANDVKGDIYLLDRGKPGSKPLRLTGRDTEDSAPSFGPDNTGLYFHHFRAGSSKGELLVVDLGKKEFTPRVLNIAVDAAFPVISPNGSKCAFVSRRDDPNGDIMIADLSTLEIHQLTSGEARDMYPGWAPDSRSLYFNRFGLDTNRDGIVSTADNAVVWQAFLTSDATVREYPLTSAGVSALQAGVAVDGFIFLARHPGGVANVFRLPPEGRIPTRSTGNAQIVLAKELDSLIPADPQLALLGYYAVFARFSEDRDVAAPAALALGRLYEEMGFG